MIRKSYFILVLSTADLYESMTIKLVRCDISNFIANSHQIITAVY